MKPLGMLGIAVSQKVLGCELVAYMLLEKSPHFLMLFLIKEREYEAIIYLEKVFKIMI